MDLDPDALFEGKLAPCSLFPFTLVFLWFLHVLVILIQVLQLIVELGVLELDTKYQIAILAVQSAERLRETPPKGGVSSF